MRLIAKQSRLQGSVEIPGSKSHTIRAVAAAALADGQSQIDAPLASMDTLAAVEAYTALGATINRQTADRWTVEGMGGRCTTPENVIDVQNSGTTLRIALGSAALLRDGLAVFTGDHQIRRRPIGPLAQSLTDLGAEVICTRGNGCVPVVVRGRLRGGKTSIQAVTSQFLSSLLFSCPMADGDCEIDVPLLNEAPYVHITLSWLERCGIKLERSELRHFHIPGGQVFQPFQIRVPADFSSATFFLAAGAMGNNDVLLRGLDFNDPQGDKAVVDYLRQMGAVIELLSEGVRVRAGTLTGCEIDMNATPDALPMMAVVGCFARGQTRLVNVPQARLKETDRIAVARAELTKMGARITELPDGLVIDESPLRGAVVQGHYDHRVVMSLAVAGTMASGETLIDTAEAMSVTFPTFVESMTRMGGDVRLHDD